MKGALASTIIILNVLKECLTGTLGVCVLIFGHRLKVVVELLVYLYGNSLPHVERIKMIRRMLIIISITYLIPDFVYNFIGPVFDVKNAIHETRSGNFDDQDHMMGNSKL